ncbi:DUF6402 family protein [Acidovorax sp. NCPPB 3576]|uniref:DUF6402 family protein n=1 Tax=Acidovorax sp. NCPPB 3576 TaxID=2940488 RepID=UPI0023491604|nr:DUF6402 family protein [Acidovorax sp. NCPPB 3576]WCM89496.1 DUF6402 family protein [Acidovorax sp. NCPPB 3576]
MNDIVAVPQEALRAELARKIAPKYATRLFQLRDIPNVMRSRLGWPVASNLMERWFNGAAYQMTEGVKGSLEGNRLNQLPASQLDDSTVTMEWALGFARVRAAIRQLQAKWASPAGIQQLKIRVGRASLGRNNSCWRFGNLGQPPAVLDSTCQINYLVFGKMGDPLDDLYGAMGEAQIKVAVSGIVTTQGFGKASIQVDELAFYLRDSYDFNDGKFFISQPLGCWGFNGMACGIGTRISVPVDLQTVDEAPSSVQHRKYLVQNADFRAWRAKNNKGGDFMVLSNALRIKLPFSQKIAW